VDLPTVFFILAFLFLIVCASNMVAIFLACLPLSRPFKFLFVLYGIVQSAVIIAPLVTYALELMRSGVGAMMTGRDFWISTLSATGMVVAVIGLFFVLSVALISPPSANRALPVRLYLSGCWLLGGILSFWWVVQAGNAQRMLVWTYPTLGVLVLALLVTISNSDQRSQRVGRKIPAALPLRLLAFLFFNGAAGGLVWLAGIFVLTELATLAVMSSFSSTSMGADEQRTYLTLALYAFAYALTALFIQRKFLPRRPPKLTGLIAILLAGGWALAPAIFLFFANRLSWKSVEGLQLGNVFNVLYSRDTSQLIWHEYFAGGWLAVALCLNAGWFVRQLRNFRPAEKIIEPAAAGAKS
jgi:hypothetical protein